MAIKNTLKKVALGLVAGAALANAGNAAEIFGRVGTYFDTRSMPTASITLNALKLPFGTKFFGFTDFFMSKDDNAKFDGAYGEYQLSRPIWKGFGISGEYNRDFSLPKGVHRLGVFYEPNLSKVMKDGFFGITFNALATEHIGSQLIFYGGKQFKNGDMYVDGFLDYNFKSDVVVTEVQFGKRVYKDLFAVGEVRYNGFMQKDNFGVGLGLELKF